MHFLPKFQNLLEELTFHLEVLYNKLNQFRTSLNDFSNSLFQITEFLNIPYSDDLIEKLISKYQLEPSNYIVDLLYEALIKEL